MKLLPLPLSIVIAVFTCCNSQQKPANSRKPTSSISRDSIKKADSLKASLDWDCNCLKKDTVLPSLTKVHYIKQGSKYKISWGNSTYSRTYDTSFECLVDKNSGVWDFVPSLIGETKNYLIFQNVLYTSGGGNPSPIAYTAFICPKNKTESVRRENFIMDLEDDYLIYADGMINAVNVLNIETNKVQQFTLSPMPAPARVPGMNIEIIGINRGWLSLKYETMASDYINTKFLKKSYKLRI